MEEPTRATNPFDDEPDRATIAAARGGDRPAQATLLRCIQDRLWRVCHALSQAPEDAVQETALRLLMQLPSFAGQSRLTTWATGIAVNVCREHRRKHRLVPPAVGHAFADATPEMDAGDALHHALAALPPRQREAVVLRYLEGLDVRQTAELMGVARGTVKATVHAGLRRLRELLEDFQ